MILAAQTVERGAIGPLRLTALRAGYALMVIGLGLTVWPKVIGLAEPSSLMSGVVRSMLAAMSALAVVGLWRPLRMLPLLLFEVAWKAIWLLSVAWPLSASGRMDAAVQETVWECLLAVVFLAVIPWDYVFGALLGRSQGIHAIDLSAKRM